MEPGHLGCRRRARSRPHGARAAGTSKQGTSDGRGEAAHSTAHRIREGRTGNTARRRAPRPPERPSTSRKRRTSRPALTEHVGDERNLIRTVSVRRTGQGRANRYAVYLDRQCTADIVGSECTAYRQRDGLHGQRGRRSPHRRTHTETAGRARGGLCPGRGADRLGVVVDPIGSAAKAHPPRRGIAAKSRKRRLRRGQRKDRTMSKRARRNSGVCWFRGSATPSPAPPIDAR